MTFRKMVALAGLGGILYAHRKHGGEWTVASFKQSCDDLIDGAKARVKDLRSQAETRLHDAAAKVASETDKSADARFGKDVTGYGSSGYGYGGGSTNR